MAGGEGEVLSIRIGANITGMWRDISVITIKTFILILILKGWLTSRDHDVGPYSSYGPWRYKKHHKNFVSLSVTVLFQL